MNMRLIALFVVNVAWGIGTGHSQQIAFHYDFLPLAGNISDIAINNAGDIVATPAGSPTSFLLRADGTLTLIGIPGASETRATGINAAGVVVGSFLSADRRFTTAYIRQPDGGLQTFGGLIGSNTVAWGISDNGYVIGETSGPSATLPGLWVRKADGTFEALNSPNGSTGTDINDVLQVAQGPGIAAHASGDFAEILDPEGRSTSIYSINNRGDSAGYAFVSAAEIIPFFGSAEGTFVNLAVPGAPDAIPRGINDSGVIVGISSAGAFIATPYVIPEPGTWVLVLSGLAIVGLRRARRITETSRSRPPSR